jgi:hypothetical protein
MMARARSTAKPPVGESTAQAEFARYKERVEASGAAAPFASPRSVGAIPAWSLQPGAAMPPPGGPQAWGPAGAGSGATTSAVQGLGTTIRLSVDALNAALANSIAMLGGASRAWSARYGDEGCECGCNGYDCCCVMGCGCGCCEPSVGTCCC